MVAQRAYFRRWGVIPAELFDGTPSASLAPATALFIHGSWLHLLGNMLFFYVFGAMTEERMGHIQFAVFYVVCGYLALLGYAIAKLRLRAVPGRRLGGDLRGPRRRSCTCSPGPG